LPTTALHRLRLRRGQTLRDLAADVGCSYQTIHRLEHGRAATALPRTRAALERTLGLPFEVLVGPETGLNANEASTR
jgi:transcriptional regulator with XRE-family HTH domain